MNRMTKESACFDSNCKHRTYLLDNAGSHVVHGQPV